MVAVVVVVVVIVVVLLVVGGVVLARRRRTRALRERFGPEYDRVLERSSSRKEAEATLTERRDRHEQLELRPLAPRDVERYRSDWTRIQRSFVDDPEAAVERSDELVTAIMRDRGYPVEDFEQRAADVSAAHPDVTEHYRDARRVRDAQREGSAGTEDMRSAVTSYRALVDSLLEDATDGDDDGGGRHRGGRGISGERGPEDTGGSARASREDGSRR